MSEKTVAVPELRAGRVWLGGDTKSRSLFRVDRMERPEWVILSIFGTCAAVTIFMWHSVLSFLSVRSLLAWAGAWLSALIFRRWGWIARFRCGFARAFRGRCAAGLVCALGLVRLRRRGWGRSCLRTWKPRLASLVWVSMRVLQMAAQRARISRLWSKRRGVLARRVRPGVHCWRICRLSHPRCLT